MIRRLIFVLLFCLPLSATNWYVATTGSDSNPGTIGSPFLTISHGYAVAACGDTVNVGPGTYGSFSMNRTCTSGSRLSVVCTTKWSCNIPVENWTGPSYNTLQGFEIDGTRSPGSCCGIDLHAETGFWILGNKIHDTASTCNSLSTAVLLLDAEATGDPSTPTFGNHIVDGNFIYHNNCGYNGATTPNNSGQHGIYSVLSGDIVRNNIVVDQGGGWCIHSFHIVDNWTVTNNTLANCQNGGIVIGGGGSTQNNTTIINNYVANSGNATTSNGGINFRQCGTSMVGQNNAGYGNTPSLYVGTCSGITQGGTQVGSNSDFVNYTGSNPDTANFHPTLNSVANRNGTTTCAAGHTGCTPALDFDGNPQTSPPTIGAYAAPFSGPTNFYVSPSGNDNNPGTQASPWQTFRKANAAYTLGAAGTTVHFADGTYAETPTLACVGVTGAAFCITHGGNSAAPVIFQCDNGLNGNQGHPGVSGHCLLRATSDNSTQELFGTQNANYTTIQGFDIGGDATHPATLFQSAVLMMAKDGTSNFNQVNHNYIHDVAKLANDGNGFGNGCPSEGAVGVDYGFPAQPGTIPTGLKFIGNWVNNFGDTTNTGCNQTHALYIGAGPNVIAENNIVGNAPGSGIKLYGSNCGSIVSNNVVYRTGWWGILVQSSGETRNDGCLGLGITPGKSTIINNIIANTGYNAQCGAIALGDGTTTNRFDSNLFLGLINRANFPVVNCTATPIASTNNLTSTTALTFVNYSDTPTASTDFHLKAGSVAIQAGGSTCTSGGLTPCVPPNDYASTVRPSGGAQDLGVFIFSGTGVPVVQFSPSPLAFGTVPVGTPSALTATLSNIGQANLTFTAATISGANASVFVITSTTCTSPLAAGASCTYSITATPTATTTQTANLTLNDNASGSPHQLPLTVTGGAAGITFNPTSLAFGVVALGSSSAIMTFTVTSSGTAPLNLTSPAVFTGDFAPGGTGTCHQPSTINPGQSCIISVVFTPTAAGFRAGSVSLATNVVGSPQLEPLNGTGGQAGLSLTPATANCGSQQIGTSSTCQAFTVTNTGTINTTGITPSFSGAVPAAYTQSNNCTTLAPAATCTITVFFKPIAAGAQNATLSVASSAPTSPNTSTLTGIGVLPATIILTPATVNFGNVLNGTFSPVANVTLTNSGGTTVTLSSISLVGSNPSDFIAGECSTSTNGFSDNFSGGSLSSRWQIDTGQAPGTIPGVNAGSFSAGNVDLSWGMLGLKVTQAGAAPVTSVGAEIRAVNPFGFGTYRWQMKAASTATDPFTAGTAVSGQISSNFILNSSTANPYTEIDSPEIEGRTPNTLEWTTWTTPSLNTSVSTTLANPEAAFHLYSFKWVPASVAFSVDGSVVATNTTNIPSAVANPMINLWGTNSNSFGGTATVGTTRWMWVKGFAFTPSGITSVAAGASCTIPVFFSPQSTGTRNAVLSIADSASGSPHQASLSGTSIAPVSSLTPLSVAFGNQAVGTQSASQNFTLSNTGTGILIFTLSLGGTNPGDFLLLANSCTSPMQPGQSCLVPVAFKPTTSGARSATVISTDSASGSPRSVSVTGTGIVTSPAVCLSTRSVNFGNQPVGTTSGALPITLTNCGTANLIVSGVTPTGNFNETNNCTTVIPGGTCTINGKFSPLSAGALVGQFSIASNASSSPDLVSLQGFGTTTGATLTSTAAFGHVIVGQLSPPINLTLANTGNQSLNVNAPTLGGTNPGDFSFVSACGPTLAPNANCLITVSFQPTTTGARSAVLTQSFGNGVASVTSALSGTGDAATPTLVFVPTSIDFGNVTTSVTSPVKTAQIQNTGTANLTFSSIALTGTNSGDYAIVNDNCSGSPLPPGNLCTVTLDVTPGGTGARTANLESTDNASGSPHDLPLTVNGVSAPAPKALLAPTTVAFSPPTITKGSTSAAQTVTLSNIGNADLIVSNVGLAGVNPTSFTQTNNCGTVSAGSSCAATVNCVPTVAGSLTATLVFTDNDSTVTQTATLSCTAKTGHGKHALGVTSINFNNQTVGTTSGPAVFTITNVGDDVLNVSSVVTSGNFADTTNCACCIGIGASCSVSVTFSPQQLCGQFAADGTTCISDVHLGTVTITDDDPAGPATVSLQGTAVPIPPPPGPIVVTMGGKLLVGGHLVVGVQ